MARLRHGTHYHETKVCHTYVGILATIQYNLHISLGNTSMHTNSETWQCK